ncbi:ABC transporter substrate-binding protein [Mesorhizobium sp. YC-39]|uniref:ABC transporter substrate-binding protein n=1 Tax=unclassified Mesorhizobium TaxID=325217 RepID=UPI0021E8A2D4|nr:MULTISPECIES: ABC transporter substrate-binding protein [unclassified Mesorhizobium]MCV3208008.1 ABC transporter substrate-binding protein [Mesorhizobium sp. YC-2]MCV3229735.1 ABC transporter substrate-binding protein [Mesorhizobium sp. YC-39]
MRRGLLHRRALIGAVLTAPFVLSGQRKVLAAAVRRVVCLDLLPTELLLTLGVTPLAVANRALYIRLVAEPALPEGVQDLGPLTEPNAEFLQILRPELILLAAWQQPVLQRLSAIAPLVPLQSSAGKTPAVAHMIDLLRQVGSATDRADEAALWAERAEETLARARQALAVRSGRALYVCRFAANGRNLAVFGGNGLIGDVLLQLGLKNAWQGRVNASGVVSAGIEQLAADPEARIVHFDRGAETTEAMRNLARSSLWNALPAVRQGRVTAMPVIYPSGGVFSAIRFARQLAEILPQESSANG